MKERTATTKKRPRRIDDELLKAVFEDNFADFLRFLYPRAEELFDFEKEIEFMGKELLAMVPDRVSGSGKRIVDLLARVHLKDGTVKPILVHTEIEGGSKKGFAERMFEYYYRIRDRYGPPVETIGVFTGGRNQVRPSHFKEQGIDCVANYRYRAYHIFQHGEDELLAMDNVFALVVMACQKALDQGKVPEEELAHWRLVIAKVLLGHKIEPKRIVKLLVFLKNILYIGEEELNNEFDRKVLQFTDNKINMGVIELIRKREREKGIERGIERGIEQGRHLAILEFAKKLKDRGDALGKIVEVTGLSMAEVKKL